MNTITSYQGKESYIFISYAHKDKEKVFQIIEQLAAARCRIWYDEGIEYGTEWSDEIANRIYKSDCFIAFLSQNYLASNNCKNELHYANSKNKDCLSVYLEDVELPRGLEMYMAPVQSIRREAYADEGSLGAKLLKIPMVLRNQDEEAIQISSCIDQAKLCIKTNRKEEAAKLYGKAIERLRSLAKNNPEEEKYNFYLATNCRELAKLFQEIGQKENAAKLFQEEKETLFVLLVEHPEKEKYKSLYADCCNYLIQILIEMGQRKQAAEVCREAIEYRQLLAEKNPENERCQFLLYRSIEKLIMLNIENDKETEKLSRRAFDLSVSLMQKNPRKYFVIQFECRLSLAGKIKKRNPEEATQLYLEGIRISLNMTKKYPRQPWYKEGLAKTCKEFAEFLKEINRKEEAEKSCRESWEIYKSLLMDDLEENPKNDELGNKEETAYSFLCDLLEETAPEKLEELEKERGAFLQTRRLERIRKEIKGLRTLAEKNPGEESYQYSLATAYADLEKEGTPDGVDYWLFPGSKSIDIHESETALREARGILGSLAAKHPGKNKYWDDLFRYSLRLADVYIREENREETEKLYREVSGMLLSPEMKTSENEQALFNCYIEVARRFYEAMPKEAEEIYRKALELARHRLKNHPKEYGYEYDVELACEDLGEFLKDTGRKEEAAELYREALEIAYSWFRENPDEYEFESALENLCVTLTELFQEMNRTKEAEELRQKVWVNLLGYK